MTSVEKDADTGHDAGQEAQDDTDDLDALLASYETGGHEDQKKSEKKQNGNPDLNALLDEIREIKSWRENFEREFRFGENRKDLSESVAAIKKAQPALSRIKDTRIQDMLVGRGVQDPRIEEAFKRRKMDPKGWNKVLKGLSKEFADDFESEDEGEDKDAIAAASRGVSTKRPGADQDLAKKVSNMSSSEFAEFERRLRQAG